MATQEELRRAEGEARAERAFICARYDHYSYSPQLYGIIKKLETEAAWAAHARLMHKQAWNGK